MTIKINSCGSNTFYDEFLYAIFKYKKLKKKPKIKMYSFSKVIIIYMICILSFGILFYFFYNRTIDTLYRLLYYSLFFVLVLLFIYFLLAKRQIYRLKRKPLPVFIEFSELGIRYYNKVSNVKIKWDGVQNIIINRHTISFVPKSPKDPFIAVSTNYQKKVIKALEKCDKIDLLIDNSNLYKKNK